MEKNGNRETEAFAPQKTVQVTDEAGNRYEATYPKRAKGLVKHGRARFTDESQTEIILTCPPNHNLILEDHTMTEQMNNTQVTENENVVIEKRVPQLTAKEIFDQIVALQNSIPSEYTDPVREQTYQQMLNMYRHMYDDLCSNQKTEQTCDKIETISRVFKDYAAFISDSDMDTDVKCEALCGISSKLAELISSVL